ncbi:unnamed protein product [Parnassius apollo]|uniref:(apollo) hypothetical protein n=1 Tax=Parnassius apollo TaxID=110799 RepID=A0A8S3W087_PARAO|nr:unnamed protein product [Parnassius apollo]
MLQIGGQPTWITMDELLEISADTAVDDRILDRIKLLDLSQRALFGNELNVDPQILNKLCFALPALGLAQVFNSLAVDLPEKHRIIS